MSETESGLSLHHHIIPTERCGALNVYVQGDLELAHGDHIDNIAVFLTVHDMGTNHHQWQGFANHTSMSNIRAKSIFIHVDLLGQEDDAPNLKDDKYPTMQEIGEDLINILDTLRIKFVIGLGIGVGANIITRFAMMHKIRCNGIVCINPTPTKSGVLEHFKNKLSHWIGGSNINVTDQYLVLHKYGHKIDSEDNIAFETYQNALYADVNKKNLEKLVMAFINRDDITSNLDKNLLCESLFICGAKSSAFVTDVDIMHSHCDKTKTSIIKLDDVGDVLEEAPAKLAQSILLFCKGLGWLTSLVMPGVERRQSTISVSSDGEGGGRRRMSMEEFDKPNIRRLSLTKND